MNFGPISVLALLCAAPALAQGPIGHTSEVIKYACDDGVALQVAYLKLGINQSFATIAWSDKLVPMHIESVDAGETYVADDLRNAYRWHIDGNEGELTFLEVDRTGRPPNVLTGCKALN